MLKTRGSSKGVILNGLYSLGSKVEPNNYPGLQSELSDKFRVVNWTSLYKKHVVAMSRV